MKDKLLIIGTGSLADEVVSFVQRYDLFDIIGFAVDKAYLQSDNILGKPVYPLDELQKRGFVDDAKLFISISWYNYMNRHKRKMYERLKSEGFSFANLISPKATVLSTEIGEGNWINDYAYLAFDTKIGNNNTFCPYSFVGHFTQMQDHNVMSGKSSIAGSSIIGSQNYIGVSSVVFNKVRIGNKCIIGGGAVAKKDVPDYTMVIAADSYYKQCQADTIESYISIEHIKKKAEGESK